MNPYYKDYSQYLSEHFPGLKIQKLSINTGFSCPNRDGTISSGGCIYCDNRSFTPKYCDSADSITTQLKKGKEFFSRKYPEMKYLAYFQSFTSTHVNASEVLEKIYKEAIEDEDIKGIIIGTRPDCLPINILNLLERFNEMTKVFVEIGAESSFDSTLKVINRCHTWQDVEKSVYNLAKRGIEVGLHLIVGLPGEDEEMVMQTIDKVCSLPVGSIKLHQMQVIRGTRLHQMVDNGELGIKTFTPEEYLNLCIRIVKRVKGLTGGKIAIERFVSSAPPEMVVMPKWGLKNYEFSNLLINRLSEEYN